MAAFLGLDDFVQAATGANVESFLWVKDNRVGEAAATVPPIARTVSLWTYNGSPSGGAAPGATAVIPDNTTAGGLKQTDPGGGREKWLTFFSAVSRVGSGGRFTLYDRLATISGLDGTNTGAQNTSGMAVTRYTGGVGNEIWLEIYTAIGGTARTVTASYKNENGTTHTTIATAIGATNDLEATRMISLPLAVGDKGVTDVLSVTLSATTGTVGDFGVTIIHPLAYVNQPVIAVWAMGDYVMRHPGPVKIQAGACLAIQCVLDVGTSPRPQMFFNFVER